jgi:ubiquinone/menaquinone biosynthesis C-methylase UbiE
MEIKMPEPTYDYRGLIAEYWDLLRGDTSQWSSRPYFLQIIRDSGEPALDVACGTGRLLLDYMQENIDIDGVDISSDMIARAQEKAKALGLQPNLYVQVMQDLDLPRRYQTIIVPSSSFLHLTNHADIRQALKRFYHHLKPGGILAMSLRVMDPTPVEEDFHPIAMIDPQRFLFSMLSNSMKVERRLLDHGR